MKVVLLVAAILALGGNHTVYLPIVANNSTIPVDPISRLKGCGGCTNDQMDELVAYWSFVWGPWRITSNRPTYCLIKPHYHSIESGKLCSEYWGWLMWGNEMDLEGPSPAVAASKYPDAEALGVRLAVGGASQLDTNLAWLRAFRGEYISQHGYTPRIDALHAHCYYGPGDPQPCMDHVQRVIDLALEWSVPQVWLSEFACIPASDWRCPATSEVFINWLKEKRIRYSWFGARLNPEAPWDAPFVDGSLYDWDTGEITPVGEWYKGIR